MSVDFGCIKTCIFPDFEDYVEPFEDEGMSEEEQSLQKLLYRMHDFNIIICITKKIYIPLPSHTYAEMQV
jgi:hypothetical protein